MGRASGWSQKMDNWKTKKQPARAAAAQAPVGPQPPACPQVVIDLTDVNDKEDGFTPVKRATEGVHPSVYLKNPYLP